MIRKRGSSVPKEIRTQPVASARRRRSGSVVEEIIPEEEPKSRRVRNSAARNAKEIVGVGRTRLNTANTRARSASVLSLPEELEEILSPSSSRETGSIRREAVRSNARERRASSADVIHTELKRRVRNINAASVAMVSPIAEEIVESEDRVELEGGDEKPDSGQVAPTPKRRPTNKETKKEEAVKSRRGRRRKFSVTRQSSDLFSFSLPEKMDDVPLDEKGNLKN